MKQNHKKEKTKHAYIIFFVRARYLLSFEFLYAVFPALTALFLRIYNRWGWVAACFRNNNQVFRFLLCFDFPPVF